MEIETQAIANRVLKKHLALENEKHDLSKRMGFYTGILTLQAAAHQITRFGSDEVWPWVRKHFEDYLAEKRQFHGNFKNYFCGGNGTALLLWKEKLPEAKEACIRYADELLNEAPRSERNAFIRRCDTGSDKIIIDTAFAVCPFLAFTGMALDNQAYIDEAIHQGLTLVDLLRNPENGLLHQTKNIVGPGLFSEDHWSRGNGWGMLALAELLVALPSSHARYAEVVAAYRDLLKSCLAYQGESGLWYQEMTFNDDKKSYVETSGSGLILYALGVGLELGIVDPGQREAFTRGLRGYLNYILPDGSVLHTCRSCCCPGEGTIQDYLATPPVLNDPHAFGPAILAFGQAHLLGVKTIAIAQE